MSFGLILVFVGVILILQNPGVISDGSGTYWPVLLIDVGLSTLAERFSGLVGETTIRTPVDLGLDVTGEAVAGELSLLGRCLAGLFRRRSLTSRNCDTATGERRLRPTCFWAR